MLEWESFKGIPGAVGNGNDGSGVGFLPFESGLGSVLA